MIKIIKAFGLIALFVFLVAISAGFSSLFGAMAGFISNMLFPTTFAKLTTIVGFAPYQIGAIIGFVGGFFRPFMWIPPKEFRPD